MPEEEPPIREFADRGTLWLLESPENLRGLVQIVAKEVADGLDFTRAERINRSFVPDDLHKQEADLLYRIPFRDGSGEVWVYVLLEHQSKPDRTMGLRILSYMVQLWEAQRRSWEDNKIPPSRRRLHPIIPIVFYTGRRRWASPIALHALMDPPALLKRFVPQYETLFLNLHATSAEALTETGSAVAWALRVLQAAEASEERLSSILSEAVSALERLPESAQAEWRRAMRYLLLLIRHKREPMEREALYAVVNEAVTDRHAEDVEEMAMTDAQVLISQGRKEGRVEGLAEGRVEGLAEGLAEGRAEGQREMLLAQLEFKFGALPAEVLSRIAVLNESQMTDIATRLLKAQTLAELGL